MQVVSRSNVAWACAQEALRLKPPVKLYFRTTQKDTVVGDVAVPAGTTISLCVRQVCYHFCCELCVLQNRCRIVQNRHGQSHNYISKGSFFTML